MNALLTTTIALAIVGGVYGNSETLLTFDMSSSAAVQLADVGIEDRDANGVKPTITVVTGHDIVKTDTMPRFDDYNAPTIHENNYVYLPFVSNPTNNTMVQIRYTYRQTKQCPTYSGRQVQCKNYVMMYLVKVANAQDDMRTVDIVANSLKTFNLSAPSGNDIQTYLTIPAATTGYRLVIHDEGSSFDIHTVSLTRYYCHLNTATNQLPIICPDTPATNQHDVPVQCRCGDNSKPNSGNATIAYVCKFRQANDMAYYEKEPAESGTYCNCNPGYTYTTSTNGTKCCKVNPSTATTLPPPTTRTTTKPTTHAAGGQSTTKPNSAASTSTLLTTHAAGGKLTTKGVTVKPSAAGAVTTTSKKATTTGGCSKLTNSWTLAVVCLCGLSIRIYP